MRLINAILTPLNSIIVHVDRQAEEVWYRLAMMTKDIPNVHMIPLDDCAFVNWGGYSVVNATLIGMRYAIAFAGHFDYLGSISGTSFPIKSNRVIAEKLSKQNNLIYMNVQVRLTSYCCC